MKRRLRADVRARTAASAPAGAEAASSCCSFTEQRKNRNEDTRVRHLAARNNLRHGETDQILQGFSRGRRCLRRAGSPTLGQPRWLTLQFSACEAWPELVWSPRFSVFSDGSSLKAGHQTGVFKPALTALASQSALNSARMPRSSQCRIAMLRSRLKRGWPAYPGLK